MILKDEKIERTFNNYHFLAGEPFKVDCGLGIIAFAAALVLVGWDIIKSSFVPGLGKFLMMINALIIIGSLIYIADLPEGLNHVTNGFNYRKSLHFTRTLQNELKMPLESSSYSYSAKAQTQKHNNNLRLLSFVAVFRHEAYIFVRMPANVSDRRNLTDLKNIANDIADELDMLPSSFEKFHHRVNLPLGHVRRSTYEVMRVS